MISPFPPDRAARRERMKGWLGLAAITVIVALGILAFYRSR
jgi:hypothetical protein